MPWCLLFDILEAFFGISGAQWEAILAPRDHQGGLWEQQDGHEVANNMILVDLGMISGLLSVIFHVKNEQTNLSIFKPVSMSYF